MMKRDKITKQPINKIKGELKNVDNLFFVWWHADVEFKKRGNGFTF